MRPPPLPRQSHKPKFFLQSLCGALAAFAIIGVGGIVLCFALFGALAGINNQPPIAVEPGSVMVFNLNTTIKDTPSTADIGEALEGVLSGTLQTETYLLKVLDAIARAKIDSDISALLLHGNLLQAGYGSGLAAISEIRLAIEDFKQSGKPVYAYLVAPSQKITTWLQSPTRYGLIRLEKLPSMV